MNTKNDFNVEVAAEKSLNNHNLLLGFVDVKYKDKSYINDGWFFR